MMAHGTICRIIPHHNDTSHVCWSVISSRMCALFPRLSDDLVVFLEDFLHFWALCCFRQDKTCYIIYYYDCVVFEALALSFLSVDAFRSIIL